MSLTASTMLPLGVTAPEFTLLDTVSKKFMKLNDLMGNKGTLIAFICNHCPFVVPINPVLSKVAEEYRQKNIGFIAISSNDVKRYLQDAPHLMQTKAKEEGYAFPYFYDETQEVARSYHAACTPDFYLFDVGLQLVYRGQLDNSRPGNGIPATGSDLRKAMEELLEGKAITIPQKPSMGCTIKWKAVQY